MTINMLAGQNYELKNWKRTEIQRQIDNKKL